VVTLRKNLGFVQGLALYLAAVLGTGILVVPVLAWQEAGPASLIAWAILSFLGLSLAWSFATAGSQYPDAGGIQSLIEKVFGRTFGTISRWLIFFSIPAGASAAAHIFASHFCQAFLLPMSLTPWIGWGSLSLVCLANFFGLRISAGIQLILSALLVLLLAVFVVTMLPSIQISHYTPFFPKGWRGIGESTVLIFWSFLGWEAIAHLAEEFKDPKKDMVRAAIVAAVIVGVFYFAVSFVLIGVGAMSPKMESQAPLVELAEKLIGPSARLFTGLLASIICLGTMNAYTAGISRLGYSMARDGDLPKWLGKLDPKTGTPKKSVVLLFFMYSTTVLCQVLFHIPMKNFFLIPNVAFLVLYVFGSLSVAKILKGKPLSVFAAYFSAVVCALIIPFATSVLLYPLIVLLASFIYILFTSGASRCWHAASRNEENRKDHSVMIQ